MSNQPYPEVTLLRGKASGTIAEGRENASKGPAAPRSNRRAPQKDSQNGDTPEKKVHPDDRLRHIVSVLLLLAGVLLLLALVSYTPRDQANADVNLRDIFGLFANDPAVAAKADTTENWLGLLGAFISNFLVNSTVGYGTIVLPGLLGLWGLAIYKGTNYNRTTRRSLYTLLVVTIGAAIFGTAQLVSWMPHPAHEWSGIIGAFIATILTGLTGTAGSFLLLLVSLLITLIYATNSDLSTALAFVRTNAARISAELAASKSAVAAKLGKVSDEDSEEDIDNDSTRGNTAPRRGGNAEPAADNEPAQMTRRLRPVVDDTATSPAARGAQRTAGPASREIPMPEPKVMRREPVEPKHEAPPPPSPTVRDNSFRDDPLLTNAARAAMERELEMERRREEQPSPPPVQDTQNNVQILHGAPPPPSPSAVVNRLTLNVQEGETAADIESKEDGALIARMRDEQIKYVPPPVDLLVAQSEEADVRDDELKENGRILQEKLATFNIQIENLTVTPGPVVTLYEFVPAAGIKISQIESLADDIAMAMKARGIRIIAPIPGKGTVGVEIPNHKPAMVRIRSVINTAKFREADHRLPLALGKTTVGEVYCDDLSKMPHLLIAGATGSGKSVGINAILTSLLYKMHPRDLKLVIIDPKKIELSQYRALRNHFLARCPDIDEEIITNPQNSVLALKSLEMEMDRRYDILAKVGQRNIHDYNVKVEEGRYRDVKDFHHVKLPYIVLILDELADLMITAAREVEEPIARLAQLARAIGIHLIVATQRPSVDVITGVIKANFPARIAYQVASKIDSRTILDMNGAEQLLGNGDMLYLPAGQPKPLRLQNAFVSTEEVEEICERIGNQQGYTIPYMLPSVTEKAKRTSGGGGGERDELFEEAARLVVRHQQGSVSLIQRRLKVGYSRAARIVDELEMAGVVGPFDGSKARAVLLESEAELEAYI